jgi:cytoskeletal protein CcmA (bactofilin family)
MSDEKNKSSVRNMGIDAQQDYDALNDAGGKGFFSRLNTKFNDKLQSGRSGHQTRDAVTEAGDDPKVGADDLAIRRARNVNAQKMIIPEGVIIEGSLTGGSDTEVSGRVEGNITVDGRLYLGASALVSGDVRADSCKIDGLVEGKVECSQNLELGKSGRLNADVNVGKQINVAGQIFGNITTPGMLRLATGSKVNGDLRTRNFVMEEGATLNGQCIMRAPAQQGDKKK